MNVYLCYECYYDFCDSWESVVKVLDCEVKALVWTEEVEFTETNWREYKERKLNETKR